MNEERGKYLITAHLEAEGVIERSDVVGAIFGQTEGLLGTRLDLRTLQESERVGRLDVEVNSTNGRTTGEVKIATSLDRVETAIIAAALETIEQIGPCRATVFIHRIEDVRAAKRQDVVDRARELLAVGFEDSGLTSREVIERVRRDATINEITEFSGAPAGPDVATSENVILVEGRADVRRLLEFGVNNAIGVEGTNVPQGIVDLTHDRTVTAFFDGDRGGNLLLFELAQVGDIDYVTFAPQGRAVEELSRAEVYTALQERVPYEHAQDDDGAGVALPHPDASPDADGHPEADTEASEVESDAARVDDLQSHVLEVIGEASGRTRALDRDYAILDEVDVPETAILLEGVEGDPPYAIVLDGALTQATVDAAARMGVSHVVATEFDEFTKQPVDVRVHIASDVVPDLKATLT